jgi:hypothetical protein
MRMMMCFYIDNLSTNLTCFGGPVVDEFAATS